MVSRRKQRNKQFKMPWCDEVYPPKYPACDMITVKCADIHPDFLTPAKAVTYSNTQTDTNICCKEWDQGQGPGCSATKVNQFQPHHSPIWRKCVTKPLAGLNTYITQC